jgi:hypothetical protein
MTEILWGPYQEHHIAMRHGVAAEELEAAWTDRIDLAVRGDDSYESAAHHLRSSTSRMSTRASSFWTRSAMSSNSDSCEAPYSLRAKFITRTR